MDLRITNIVITALPVLATLVYIFFRLQIQRNVSDDNNGKVRRIRPQARLLEFFSSSVMVAAAVTLTLSFITMVLQVAEARSAATQIKRMY